MKKISFAEEASKYNMPQEAIINTVKEIYKKSNLLIDENNDLFIIFTDEEINELIDCFSNQRISIKKIADREGMGEDQIILLIKKLEGENKIDGVLIALPQVEFMPRKLIQQEIAECEGNIQKFSIMLANNEIGQDAYLLATRPLEAKLGDLKRSINVSSVNVSTIPPASTMNVAPNQTNLPSPHSTVQGSDFVLIQGEKIIKELESGWFAVLHHGGTFEWSKSMFRFDLLRKPILTNERIMLLNDKIMDFELPLRAIRNVEPDAIGVGNPILRIRLKNDECESLFFVCPGPKMFLGGFYLMGKAKGLVDQWAFSINGVLQHGG